MSDLLIYLFEVSVCLSVFYLLYAFAFSKQKHFTLNRWYLLLSLTLSLIIPAMQIQNEVASVAGVYTALLSEINISTQPNDAFIFTLSWQQLILTLYGIGVFIALFRLVRQLLSISKIVRSATNKIVKNGYILLTPNDKEMIGSFFNYIFWNTREQFSKEEEQLVLAHEMVHVKEKHSFDMLIVELAGVFIWFNPFIYLFKNAISVNHEFIADNAVSQADTKQYMNLLALQAISANGLSLTSYFDNKQIINRMRMIKTNTTRSTITRYLLIAPIVLMLMMTFACENSLNMEESLANAVAHQTQEVMILTDINAQPDGGMISLTNYLQENLKYPEDAKANDIEGKVFVEFIINKQGNIEDVNVLKGIGHGCDEEAARVIMNSPIWIPAKHQGKFVNQKLVLPISFVLE